jgi:flagellar L-ring protein precursor FlgH
VTARHRISPGAVLLLLGSGIASCQQPPSKENLLASLDKLPGDQGAQLPITNGAIYQSNVQGSGGLQLFRDHRAWQIGDVVTVQIAQNATATKNAAENIGRTDSVKSTVNNLFGLPTSFGRSSATTKFNPNIDYNSANTLAGSGSTAQSNSFVTTVSTMVHRIRPNGDLVIAGSDEIKLVGGKEYIRIAGVVRPEDLQGNVVLSTRMAEAHIEFSGDGELYLAPKMGILQRFFLTVSTIWPGDWF